MNAEYNHRQIWNVSYPIMLGLLAQNIIGITDTAFLGRLGEVELGGAALGGLWYLAIYMLGFGFSTGSQVLIARRNGDGQIDKIASYFVQGNLFLWALAIGIIILSLRFAAPILRPAIQSQAVFQATIEFLDSRIWGLLFAFPLVMFRAFFVGITRTRILTVSALIMAVINIFLDYVLIFGKFGFPFLGIQGAAIASVIAEALTALYLVIYLLYSVDLRKYGFYQRASYGLSQLAKVLDISFWTMIQYFVALGTWFIFFLATEHLGERPLAISNIVRSLGTLLFMSVSAYGTTANTLVSNLMGEGRTSEVPALLWRIMRQSVVVIVPIMLLLTFLPVFFLRIYSNDHALIAASIPSMLVLVWSYVFTTPGAILFQFISGTGNTRSALLIECIVLALYMAFVVGLTYMSGVDVAVYWLSEHVYWSVIFICSLLYLYKADWQSRQI